MTFLRDMTESTASTGEVWDGLGTAWYRKYGSTQRRMGTCQATQELAWVFWILIIIYPS